MLMHNHVDSNGGIIISLFSHNQIYKSGLHHMGLIE